MRLKRDHLAMTAAPPVPDEAEVNGELDGTRPLQMGQHGVAGAALGNYPHPVALACISLNLSYYVYAG